MSAVLRVTILGCGSSGGVPRIGNDWGACDPQEPRNNRKRCSVLVERVRDNETTRVLIDTGPDLRQQMLEAGIGHLDAVLYTHAHADHLHGIDDLRVFTIRNRRRIPVYMDTATRGRAEAAFGYCFETPAGSSYPPILEPHPLVAGQTVEIDGPGGRITFKPIEVVHGDIMSLAFKFAGIAYLPDVSHIPQPVLPEFEGLDVFILDALRRSQHPSHFSLSDALRCLERTKPSRAILTNMHNDLDYRTLCSELHPGVEPAYDGLIIERPSDS
ncbi:phosphoribosyl 1,2-cyclic phosphate phosphodiesterase [Roseibium hamelinense]|uniref:Phosphoribosyl 1,2-cyclic phosphate phosphodiesterase n=1 Tax=Roseibium hamelinense TaxID=150831 RepID=A0A562TH78_9HYPH|nr:MBL fold metallo-hydrolase [Roseibium hamelinense]MTI45837.1 MBL fold metallo-hydrolase [Roseibium hamelinense]TWI92981.1 phosphoribosyl 1,2-cyclic phosphate phosphodiesterase [Roseibium hamelinense]